MINSRLVRIWGGSDDSPACFQRADYGENHASFTWSRAGGPGGAATETLRITDWVSGEAKLLPEMDLGTCAPPVDSGRQYTATLWYKSSRPAQLEFYYRNRLGAWLYWTTSPAFPATSSWEKASWTTPATPAGATAVSFGLTAASDITLTSTAYSLAPAKSHRSMVLLGSLLFMVVAAGLFARGQLRYRKYARAEAELVAEEEDSEEPAGWVQAGEPEPDAGGRKLSPPVVSGAGNAVTAQSGIIGGERPVAAPRTPATEDATVEMSVVREEPPGEGSRGEAPPAGGTTSRAARQDQSQGEEATVQFPRIRLDE